jgi:hypothetical protein
MKEFLARFVVSTKLRHIFAFMSVMPRLTASRLGVHFNDRDDSRAEGRRENHLFTVESHAFSHPLFVPSEQRANRGQHSKSKVPQAIEHHSRRRLEWSPK